MKNAKILIKRGRVIDPLTGIDQIADVLIIDNKILNNEKIEIIAKKYNLKVEVVQNYYPYNNEFEQVYSKKNNPNQINLIDKNDHYLLFR